MSGSAPACSKAACDPVAGSAERAAPRATARAARSMVHLLEATMASGAAAERRAGAGSPPDRADRAGSGARSAPSKEAGRLDLVKIVAAANSAQATPACAARCRAHATASAGAVGSPAPPSVGTDEAAPPASRRRRPRSRCRAPAVPATSIQPHAANSSRQVTAKKAAWRSKPEPSSAVENRRKWVVAG